MYNSVFKIIFVICFAAVSLIRAPYVARSRRVAIAKDYTPRMERFLLALVFIGMQAIPFLYIVAGWLDFADYCLSPWVGLCGAAVFVYAA